jgi:hypothetical protein
MPNQMDWTEAGAETKPKRGRKKGEAVEAPAESEAKGEFPDVEHLTKKGLRVVPVVTGAVVDEAGNFLFYVDGHEDARSGVQAQINHQLGSGPAREEYLAPARTRAKELSEKLSQPR